MFGTRAYFIVDFAYLVTLMAPLVAFFSLRLVRKGQHNAHKLIQTLLLTLAVLAVGALEIQIRIVGGADALTQDSPYAGSGLMRYTAAIHIFGAVMTYVVWVWLVIISRRLHRSALPGTFSRRHKTMGWIVICGLCFTTVSASAVYFLAFVAS
jgi:putative membrane protein